jgi:hypothetical protein
MKNVKKEVDNLTEYKSRMLQMISDIQSRKDEISEREIELLMTEAEDLKRKSEESERAISNVTWFLIGAVSLWLAEATVILMALNQNIGTPIFGQATFLAWLLNITMFVVGIARPTETLSKKPGFFKKTFLRAIGLIPLVYALYILLLQIGLFH